MTYSECETEGVTDVSNAVPELVKVRVDWSAVEDAPAQHVNQVLAQVGPPGTDRVPDGIFITMGSVSPPALLDDNIEARDELLEKLVTRGAKVNVVCQVHMSRQMLGDLITIRQTTAAKHDAAAEPLSAQKGGGA